MRLTLPLLILALATATGCGNRGGRSGGTGGGGGGGGTSCSVRDLGSSIEDTCGGEDICVCSGAGLCEGTGTCMPAFNRRYRIGVAAVALTERSSTGECWDALCNAPDPFVEVYLDGTLLGSTETVDDTFNARWDPPATFDATVIGGSMVDLAVWDEDVSVHEGAFSCASTLTLDTLRSRNLSCTGSTGELLAVIVPL